MYVDIKKPTLFLFTDASVDPQTKIGYSAYMLLCEFEVEAPFSILKDKIKTRKFKNTTSSRLELETLLWALGKICVKNHKIIIFTDSQNTISLKSRQEKLEKNNYMTKKNIHIKNYRLYKRFFILTKRYECDLIKVKGHKKNEDKDLVDNFFTLVDKASREALREEA